MLSNRGLDSDARAAGARQAGRYAAKEAVLECHWLN
jgi:hypothetical protein